MSIVTSVTYSIKVNDQVLIPQRGLRHGDPLSIYIMCAEWLSDKIHQYTLNGLIDGIKITRRAPTISHLLFADDSLLYFKITQNSVQLMRQLLNEYEVVSGQVVNFAKSEIMTSYLEREVIHSVASSTNSNGRTQSWKSITLSIGGRQVLINLVLNIIPQYWLSCFLLPDKIIHRCINRFWWQTVGQNKPIHWIKADTMRKDKDEGGLGFYNFRYMAEVIWLTIN
ncbi:hypothetical protein QQ045_020698 [Rhodiola kirilowii]